jgi:SDR family mycofactocin-dependent oxidoreductase
MILIFLPLNREGAGMAKLHGKVALITGAARGQGRSHAVRLAEEGADIVAIDIVAPIPTAYYPPAVPADLQLTAKLAEGEGARVLTAEADVRDQAALDAVVTRALAALGRIDIVVANAGTISHAPAWELSDDQWQNVVDVNLTGVWRTVKACVPSMIARGEGGAIVLTSSVTGLHGFGNIASYSAAKHGVNGLMRTLANDLGPCNIRVNSVCPGLVSTDMMMNDETYAMFRPDVANPTLADAREVFRTKQLLPIDWLEPRDVSNAVAFLVSEEARAITGVALPVDGGQLTRG